MSASHAHSWHEDVSSCEPNSRLALHVSLDGKRSITVLPCNLKMTSLCSNHVLLVVTITKHNNQMFKQDKLISTNSTVIEGVLQKLKSEKM